MRDDVTFETRLADALGRYAELAPAMDDDTVARQAIVAGGPAGMDRWIAALRKGGFGHPASTQGRPLPRVAYLLLVLGLVLAAILVALAVGANRRESFPPPGRNGAIVFTVQGNNHDPAVSHLMNADGSNDHPIDADRCPTYSKDGGVLASVTYEGSAYLATRGADGGAARKKLLVVEPPTSVSYALSPDGTQVAWFKAVPSGPVGSLPPDGSSAVAGDTVELWVAPIDDRPGTSIVPGSSVPNEFYSSPLWSPDGSHIAFGSYVVDDATGERRRSGIHVVAVDGSDLRHLTSRPGLLDDSMSWSPDGRFLAYLGLPDGPSTPSSATGGGPTAYPARDVFVIGADGVGDRNVTSTPGFETQPEWSPDGAVLAFETSADGEAHRLTTIHMNGPTTVGPPRLGPESEWFAWSPDGTELLWLEVDTPASETYRSTLHTIDRDFDRPPTAFEAVDGLIICTPSWQRLEP